MPLLFALLPLAAKAGNPVYGVDTVSAAYMRQWYHYGDMMHYLDNWNTFVCVEQETTGSFNLPEQQVFSVAGNSHKWNKYYLDNFRIDSRITPGSTWYLPDLMTQNLSLNYFNSSLVFTEADSVPNRLLLEGNVGGIGGISPGTKQIINLFHTSATERLYTPLDYRSRMVGMGAATLDYTIHKFTSSKNSPWAFDYYYPQHLYFAYGQRSLTTHNQTGINGANPYDFYRFQLRGVLPIMPNRAFSSIHYLLHANGRQDYGSEWYYDAPELGSLHDFGAAIYGKKQDYDESYTLGLNWNTHLLRHNQEGFSRNIIDQDGEGFEPWYPSSATTEISLSTYYEKSLLSWLTLQYEGYNSAIYTSPSSAATTNAVYAQFATDTLGHIMPAEALYVYDWTMNPFWTGLLENRVGLKADYSPASWVRLRANLDFTLDGLLLKGKSMVRPNWQAQIGADFHPCKWFRAEVNLSKQRVAFNYDDARFLSSDYMNGTIRYWHDTNADLRVQDGERGSVFSNTGGAYHRAQKKLWETSYAVLDLPVYFTFGRHQVQFMQSFRKYWNVWNVQYDGPLSDYGEYRTAEVKTDLQVQNREVFFPYEGVEKRYVIKQKYADGVFGNKWLTGTPFYMSSVIKYQYNGRKVTFGVAWQSYEMVGVAALANGVLSNDLNVLSESSANPNSTMNVQHPGTAVPHRATGRLDQDRAYECWILLTYNILPNLGVTLHGKFRDGQPVSGFSTTMAEDAAGNRRIEIMNSRTRGINVYDSNFGSREDAFFNIDLRVDYRPQIANREWRFALTCYNIYDFGTALNECSFPENMRMTRHTLAICVPRGLLLQVGIGL